MCDASTGQVVTQAATYPTASLCVRAAGDASRGEEFVSIDQGYMVSGMETGWPAACARTAMEENGGSAPPLKRSCLTKQDFSTTDARGCTQISD
jgi:hypothetical protein